MTHRGPRVAALCGLVLSLGGRPSLPVAQPLPPPPSSASPPAAAPVPPPPSASPSASPPAAAPVPPSPSATSRQQGAEALLRVRHLGVARLENGELDQAVTLLGQAVALGGEQPLDRFNLGLAHLARGDLRQAEQELSLAAAARADLPQPAYALGILALRQGDAARARRELERALRLAPHDPATLYNLGVVEERLEHQAAAAARYRLVLKLGWSVGGVHFLAALYRHARLQLALGRTAEGQRELQLYQDYFARVGKAGGEAELQGGPLLWPLFVPVPPADLGTRPEPGPPLLVLQSPAATGLPPTAAPRAAADPRAGRVVAADLTGDGRPELLATVGGRLRLYRGQEGGRFLEVTAKSGPALAHPVPARGVAVGDYDNDDDLDLFVSAAGPGRLLRNRGDGTFEDATRAAGLAGQEGLADALWVDVDQEGDLDLLGLGHRDPRGRPTANRLFLNQSVGTFVAETGRPGLTAGRGLTTAALAVDLDDDEDIDLLLAREESWSLVLANQREGRFVDQAPALGLADGQPLTGLAVGDLDGDGDWDLLTLGPAGVVLRLQAAGSFSAQPLPGTAGARALVLVDLQLDGREELVVGGPGATVTVFHNQGGGRLEPASPLPVAAPVTGLAAADLDADAVPDLVVATEAGLQVLHNATPDPGRFLQVSLRGRKNGKRGDGALLELRAGGLYVRRLAGPEPLILGVGTRSQVDAVRVRWPNGLFQHLVDPAVGARATVQEVQELAGSCPFVYTWDGERFRFVNDFLGGGGLGLPTGDGGYLPPDADEYLLIEGHLLQPRDGLLTLQLTEELRRENLYLDRVRLHVVDHPSGTRVVPDERFTIPGPTGERRFRYHDAEARPPACFVDDYGEDLRPLIAARDEQMAGSFILAPEQVRGLVEPHSYVLSLGDTRAVRELWLVMTGWVYWAGGSSGIAASQDPRHALGPVRLEVADGQGGWQEGIPDIGFPSGKTKVMPVDLTPVLRPVADFQVRITTSLRLHWDQVLVVTDPQPVPVVETVLAPARAQLYDRGFSRRLDDRLDLPERFVFDELSPPAEVRFDQGLGLLTRYGDVLPLLLAQDDLLAVFSAGDALEVSFAADSLPALPPGWVRDYLLYTVGWNKDGDLNNGTGSTVDPLPFHGMPGYPYPAAQYPADPAHQEYRARWNTRPGRAQVVDLRP